MSDDRNEAGQFAPAPEPAFGIEGVEREAGYVPYKEDAEPEPELTVAEAAEELVAQSTPESEIKTYSAIDDLPDNVTLTVEQASQMLSDEHAKQAEALENAEADRLRAEVDELRGVKPEAEAKEAATETSAEPVQPGELDPEVEKALTNPKIQAVLSQQVAEVESAREQHMAAVDGAAQIAIASFMERFPEFAHIPQENMGDAIRAMQQQDPARAAQVAATIQRTLGLFDRQRALHQQAEQQKQSKFQDYAKVEDARFSELVKSESKDTMDAVPKLIHEALIEYGVDPAEFGRLGLQSEFLRSAAAQRLLVDAAKYRQITKAAKSVANRERLPPVLRPGTSSPSGQRVDSERVQALNRKSELTVKEATELYSLNHRARG